MAVYQSYLLEDEDIEIQGVGFRDITDTMVDPAIAMCMISRQGERYPRPGWPVFASNMSVYLKVNGLVSLGALEVKF